MPKQRVTSLPHALSARLSMAYHSMSDLDLTLFSTIKNIQDIIGCKSLSIWLLSADQTELECTHAVGTHAADLLGDLMRANKFIAAWNKNPADAIDDFANTPHTKWLDPKTHLSLFNLPPKQWIVSPLTARGKPIGVLIAVQKSGRAAFSNADRATVHTAAPEIAVAIQNTQLYEQHNKFKERQELFNQVSQHFHQTLDLDTLIPRIFSDVNKALKAEAQSIWLVDQPNEVIKCRYATGGESVLLIGFSVPLSTQSIVGTSVLQKQSIIIQDAQKDRRRARSADEWTGFVTRSLMTVPLVLQETAIGAIQAVNKRGGQLFTQEDLDLFRAIADNAAMAVHNAQLVAELQNSYDLTLEALSAALDLRDHETDGHSRRVVEYTSRLAEQFGLDKGTINNIRRGALIHDIGKIGVPDAVLLKEGELSETERKIIERHPQAGYNMLSGISYLQEEIQIVLCHQEKWDGTGYPFGLRGEQIPLGARLFAIADTFDAITSDRPYRKGRPYETARQLIIEESGKQFDPQTVSAFLSIPPEEWAEIRERVTKEIAKRTASRAETQIK